MTQNTNPYRDLEERTTRFAKSVLFLCQKLTNNTINNRYVDQVIRSSGSIGANYREANEAISKKDLAHRIRISRKETKETHHWLELIAAANPGISTEVEMLLKESDELRNIFSSILSKVMSDVSRV